MLRSIRTVTAAKQVLFVACSCACLFYHPGVSQGAPYKGSKVQVPSLAAPDRGSVTGSLSKLSFGPGHVPRGIYQLSSSMAVPQDRGPLLAQIFPQYAPDQGISEWGSGWSVDLSIRRYREVGSLDYSSDAFTSPWGRLKQGTDEMYYPSGFPGTY